MPTTLRNVTVPRKPLDRDRALGDVREPEDGSIAGGLSSSTYSGRPPQSSRQASFRPRESKPTGLVEVPVTGGKVSVRTGRQRRHAGGGRRGKVKGFSNQSRRRCSSVLASICRLAAPLFVTLTYPGDWDTNPAKWKGDLDVWWRRVERRWPGASCVWVLEPQRRGAPHYHLLVWGVPCAGLRFWAKDSWFEVVGSGDERHRLAGTQVDPSRSQKGVQAYLSSYVASTAKAGWDDYEDMYPDGVGRCWGAKGKERLPLSDVETVEMTDRQAARLIRFLTNYVNAQKRAWAKGKGWRSYYKMRSGLPSFTCLNVDPAQWLSLIRSGVLDVPGGGSGGIPSERVVKGRYGRLAGPIGLLP